MRSFEINGNEGILSGDIDESLSNILSSIDGCKYHRLHKCFIIAITKENITELISILIGYDFHIIGDIDELQDSLIKRKKTRDDVQSEIVGLSKEHKNLFMEWVTGLGKTLGAFKIIKEHKGRWLFVYKETTHLNNHLDDLEKHGLSYLNERIDWTTYHSIHKFKDVEYTGVILDECHASTSDLRQEKLSEFKDCKVIATSATIDSEVKRVLTSIFGSFFTHKVTFDDALEWEILPKPKIYLIPLVLDDEKVKETIVIKKGKKPSKKVETSFNGRWEYMKAKDTEITVHCTEQQKYDYFTDQINYFSNLYRTNGQIYIKNRFLQLGTQRKRYLASIKTDVAKLILERIKDKKYICFTGSVPQAKELGGENTVYSASKKNEQTVSDFNEGIIKSIYAVNMLKEGVNLNDIEASLVIQLSSKELDIVQRTGRILRAKVQPEQYIIYFKDTQDEKYLQNVINLFDTEELFVSDI